jgi:hypothetical protein
MSIRLAPKLAVKGHNRERFRALSARRGFGRATPSARVCFLRQRAPALCAADAPLMRRSVETV